jgi:flagellar motility protein MotE (MotC chaperone)
MDSKIVAKLILNLSDDTARDLIYSMKKRKAAEVLSNLSPEIAIRLTRAR